MDRIWKRIVPMVQRSLQSAIEGDLFSNKEYSLIQILSPLINIARNIYLNLPMSILSKT